MNGAEEGQEDDGAGRGGATTRRGCGTQLDCGFLEDYVQYYGDGFQRVAESIVDSSSVAVDASCGPRRGCKYVCVQCNHTFATHAASKAHARTRHSGEAVQVQVKPVRKGRQCPHCQDVFERDVFFSHLRKCELTSHLFQCGRCGFKGRDVHQVKQHALKKHPKELFEYVYNAKAVDSTEATQNESQGDSLVADKSALSKWKCPICDKSMKKFKYLKVHMDLHRRVRKKCAYCAYTSTQEAQVTHHLRTKHKSLEPQIVTIQLDENDTLVAESVDDELSQLCQKYAKHDPVPGKWRRRYDCPHCDYTCEFAASYTRHLKRHLGEGVLFQCGHCDFKSRERYYVRRHLARIHRGLPEIVLEDKPAENSIIQGLKQKAPNNLPEVRVDAKGDETEVPVSENQWCNMQPSEAEQPSEVEMVEQGDTLLDSGRTNPSETSDTTPYSVTHDNTHSSHNSTAAHEDVNMLSIPDMSCDNPSGDSQMEPVIGTTLGDSNGENTEAMSSRDVCMTSEEGIISISADNSLIEPVSGATGSACDIEANTTDVTRSTGDNVEDDSDISKPITPWSTLGVQDFIAEKTAKHTTCICGVRTVTKAFYKHVKTHQQVKPFKCGHCQYRSMERAKVRVHSAFVHPELPPHVIKSTSPSAAKSQHPCQICDREVSCLPGAAADHFASHYGFYPYKCATCDYLATSLDDAGQHGMTCHDGDITLVHETGSEPPQGLRQALADFVESSLQKQRKVRRIFTCPLCGKQVQRHAATVRRHFYAHYGYRPFKCGHCDYQGLSAGEIKQHSVSHGDNVKLKVERSGQEAPEGLEDLITKLMEGARSGQGRVCNGVMKTPEGQAWRSSLLRGTCPWCNKDMKQDRSNAFRHYKAHFFTSPEDVNMDQIKDHLLEHCHSASEDLISDVLLLLSSSGTSTPIQKSAPSVWKKCDKCEAKFRRPASLHQHRLRCHAESTETFRCRQCPFWHFSRGAVRRHLLASHEDVDANDVVPATRGKNGQLCEQAQGVPEEELHFNIVQNEDAGMTFVELKEQRLDDNFTANQDSIKSFSEKIVVEFISTEQPILDSMGRRSSVLD